MPEQGLVRNRAIGEGLTAEQRHANDRVMRVMHFFGADPVFIARLAAAAILELSQQGDFEGVKMLRDHANDCLCANKVPPGAQKMAPVARSGAGARS
jgi:hypothetical protein